MTINFLMNYFEVISNTYASSVNYLWKLITNPVGNGYLNGLYFLVAISLLVWGLEVVLPWRRNQKRIRKDFWLDTFYMFFNFYIFDVIAFAALVKVTYLLFSDFTSMLGYTGGVLVDFSNVHWLLQMVLFFVVIDFVQWCVHLLLHRVPFLWRFHKIHHSVKEMGFAAHLRYHFVENMVYRPAKYVIVSLLFGFQFENIFYIYYISVLIGHLNHANLNLDYGPMRFLLNNPKMHIWHHAKQFPESHPNGVNFGISLSVWDYLFGTSYVPSSGRDLELGFENDEHYPESFLGQLVEPFTRRK